jgi:hypothetical protein
MGGTSTSVYDASDDDNNKDHDNDEDYDDDDDHNHDDGCFVYICR